MAGGMNRRRAESTSLHERIHGTPPTEPEVAPQDPSPGPSPQAMPSPQAIRHCWVTDEHGRLPGLLLEWQRAAGGWRGRVVRPAADGGAWVIVEEWVMAERLDP